MATVTLKGDPINTNGELPKIGSTAPDFRLVNGELQEVSLKNFAGKKKLLNIVPSLGTSVCQISARRFNDAAGSLTGTVVLTILTILICG